jgi:hypothetical protein
MKALGIAVALVIAVVPGTAPTLFAQSNAREPLIFQSTAMPSGDGRATIQNAGKVPLTAYLFEVLCEPCSPMQADQHTYRGYDAITAKGGRAVPPSASRTETLGACHCNKASLNSPAKAVLKAALFADGTTYGEPQWVKALIQHRERSRRAIELAIDALNRSAGNTTRQDYLARLDQARDSVAALRKGLPTVEFPDFDPFAFGARQLATANQGRLRKTVEGVMAALRSMHAGYSSSENR